MSNKMLTLMMGFVAFLILAVGLVFVIALAGGGSDDDDAAPVDGDSESNSTSGKICEGSTLIIPGEDPSSVLDPIQVGDVTTAEYVVEIFGGLVTLDPAGDDGEPKTVVSGDERPAVLRGEFQQP